MLEPTSCWRTTLRSGVTPVLFSVALFPSAVLAQAPPGAPTVDVSTAYRLPSVFIENIVLEDTAGSGTLRGTFDMVSRHESLLGDLGYELYLNKPTATAPPPPNTLVTEQAVTFDHLVVPQNVTLLPNERKTIPFTYTPPTVPRDEYLLRIRVLTSQETRLGWGDAKVTLGGDGGFVTIGEGRVVASKPDSMLFRAPNDVQSQTEADPAEGINVDPGSRVELRYRLTNVGKVPVTGRPTLQTYVWGPSGEKVRTETGDHVTLKPGEKSALLTFATQAPERPMAYHAELTLMDESGTRVSSPVAYRYVVRGTSGRVVQAKFGALSAQDASVVAHVTGPADRTSTSDVTVTAALLNGSAQVATETSKRLRLRDGGQELTFTFPLAASLEKPGARITLQDANETVLDTYEFHVDVPAPVEPPGGGTVTAAARAGMQAVWAVIVLLLALAAIVTLFIIPRRRRGTGGTTIMRVTLLFALLGAAAGVLLLSPGRPARASGQGVDYRTTSGITLFVNVPTHNGTEPDPTAVTFAADLSFTVCDNSSFGGAAVIERYEGPGHVTRGSLSEWKNYDMPYYTEDVIFPNDLGKVTKSFKWTCNLGDSDWSCKLTTTEPSTRWVKIAESPGSLFEGTDYFRPVTATLALPASWDQATLRLFGFKRKYGSTRRARDLDGVWRDYVVDTYLQHDDWNAMYLYLNFPPAYDSACAWTTPPTSPVAAGQPFTATAFLTNTGRLPWTSAATTLQSQSSPANLWGVSSVSLPATVNPGSDVTLTINATAPATLGTYAFDWRIADAAAGGAFGAPCAQQVEVTLPLPSLTCTPPSQLIITNQSSSFTAEGGTGSYIWSVTPTDNVTPLPSTGAIYSPAFSAPGEYTLVVNDTGGSPPDTCTANVSALPVSCAPSSQTVNQNASAALTASGGTEPYTWSAPGGNPLSGNGASFSTTYSATGPKTVIVTDGSGTPNSCDVTVSSLGVPPGRTREVPF